MAKFPLKSDEERSELLTSLDPVDDLAAYDFAYPESSVACEPAPDRDASQLWTFAASVTRRPFAALETLLRPGDLLLLNHTRVLPVRFDARREQGGQSEILLVTDADGHPLTLDAGLIPEEGRLFEAIVLRSGRLRPGSRLQFRGGSAEAVEPVANGRWLLRVRSQLPNVNVFSGGSMPLPPYLRKATKESERSPAVDARDLERYQTVFAKEGGAIAAPTAGLHFTQELLERLREKKVCVETLRLDVSYGTFQPIRHRDLSLHQMDREFYEIPLAVVEQIRQAKSQGRRVVAVGTTVMRALESAALVGFPQGPQETRLFIRPGFSFQIVDALITNFHLPQSSLLILVSAFFGRERILEGYRAAIAEGARLFSYGDAMFLERKADR